MKRVDWWVLWYLTGAALAFGLAFVYTMEFKPEKDLMISAVAFGGCSWLGVGLMLGAFMGQLITAVSL